jgi:hypothetical protein
MFVEGTCRTSLVRPTRRTRVTDRWHTVDPSYQQRIARAAADVWAGSGTRGDSPASDGYTYKFCQLKHILELSGAEEARLLGCRRHSRIAALDSDFPKSKILTRT